MHQVRTSILFGCCCQYCAASPRQQMVIANGRKPHLCTLVNLPQKFISFCPKIETLVCDTHPFYQWVSSGGSWSYYFPSFRNVGDLSQIWAFSYSRFRFSLDPRIRTALDVRLLKNMLLTDQTRPMVRRCWGNTVRSRILVYGRILGNPIVHLVEKPAE